MFLGKHPSENIPVMTAILIYHLHSTMARSASVFLLLVALLCSALAQAATVYVKNYNYSNTIGGVTRDKYKMAVQIEGYHGELSGSTSNGRKKYCSNDGVFCVKAVSPSCNSNHAFKFYYGNRSTTINMDQKPTCNTWPKEPGCKTCNTGELSFNGSGFTFNI
ncbi:hypothetical protein BGZ94_007653 [Podila epigama]|nr:hypothetical protein BGZ94_007653 [Podila epigama]